MYVWGTWNVFSVFYLLHSALRFGYRRRLKWGTPLYTIRAPTFFEKIYSLISIYKYLTFILTCYLYSRFQYFDINILGYYVNVKEICRHKIIVEIILGLSSFWKWLKTLVLWKLLPCINVSQKSAKFRYLKL